MIGKGVIEGCAGTAPIIWRMKDRRDDAPQASAIYRAECRGDKCFVLAFMFKGQPLVVVVPAQPSPLCVGLDKTTLRIIRRILLDVGIEAPYITACRVIGTLIRESLRETLEALRQAGIVDRLTE